MCLITSLVSVSLKYTLLDINTLFVDTMQWLLLKSIDNQFWPIKSIG